jgi:hypothetical protein
VTEHVFEPPSYWSQIAFVEANHEAAHALAAFLLGLEVLEARIDRPLRGGREPVLGHCVIRLLPVGPERWKHIAVSIAPLVMTNRVPTWKPSLYDDDGDIFNAAVRVHDLGIDEDGWDDIVSLITEFFELPSSKAAHRALSDALLERGAIAGAELKEIFDTAIAQATQTNTRE